MPCGFLHSRSAQKRSFKSLRDGPSPMSADDEPSRFFSVLETWSSVSPRHCLDLRIPEGYAKAHLIPSTNIPFSLLESSFSQLPPRLSATSFLLVTSPHTYFSGLPVAGFLSLRGWRVDGVIEVGTDESAKEIWSAAEKLGVLGTGREGAELMFKPSPILGEWIDFIEQSLSLKERLTMVDIGCGSGRDMGFLVSREREWSVIGIDNWRKALARAGVLVKSINSSRTSMFHHAEVREDGTIIALPAKTNSPEPPVKDVDLVVISRFFQRELFKKLHHYIAPQGFLVFSQFMDPPEGGKDYETPPKERRVQKGQVEEILEGIDGWEVLQTRDSTSEDGRPMWSVVARWHC